MKATFKTFDILKPKLYNNHKPTKKRKLGFINCLSSDCENFYYINDFIYYKINKNNLILYIKNQKIIITKNKITTKINDYNFINFLILTLMKDDVLVNNTYIKKGYCFDSNFNIVGYDFKTGLKFLYKLYLT